MIAAAAWWQDEPLALMSNHRDLLAAGFQAHRRALTGYLTRLVVREDVAEELVELDRFFGAGRGDPLAGTAGDLDARLAIVKAGRDAPLGPWHRQMMRLVAEVLDESPHSPAAGARGAWQRGNVGR